MTVIVTALIRIDGSYVKLECDILHRVGENGYQSKKEMTLFSVSYKLRREKGKYLLILKIKRLIRTLPIESQAENGDNSAR